MTEQDMRDKPEMQNQEAGVDELRKAAQTLTGPTASVGAQGARLVENGVEADGPVLQNGSVVVAQSESTTEHYDGTEGPVAPGTVAYQQAGEAEPWNSGRDSFSSEPEALTEAEREAPLADQFSSNVTVIRRDGQPVNTASETNRGGALSDFRKSMAVE